MTDQPDSGVTGPGNRVSQHNQQTLHVHVHQVPHGGDLAGRMEGSIAREEGNAPLAGCEVQLFFGPIGEHPVATTQTDCDGRFSFHDLPAGFYGLRLILPGNHRVHLHNLRVRPGESSQPRLILSGKQTLTRFSPALEGADDGFLVRGIPMEHTE